ncbi:SdpA family antimicrobial peptide system protein [Phycicoccus elongatus]|uniref:SdpA family antimicrobial peptide system protein n=1 Tax=Phycicoccus elongatus TaxID=101689 RepID=UPI0037830794
MTVPSAQAHPRTQLRLGRAALALGAIWAIVILYVVVTQLPPSAVVLPFQESVRMPIRAGATQGWAFFTKSPREPSLIAVRANGVGGYSSAILAPHSEPRNAFGLNRASRAQGVELGLLAGALNSDNWTDCAGTSLAECASTIPAGAVARIDDPMPAPSLCGRLLLVGQEPTPWAWAGQETDAMPKRVAQLEVNCS